VPPTSTNVTSVHGPIGVSYLHSCFVEKGSPLPRTGASCSLTAARKRLLDLLVVGAPGFPRDLERLPVAPPDERGRHAESIVAGERFQVCQRPDGQAGSDRPQQGKVLPDLAPALLQRPAVIPDGELVGGRSRMSHQPANATAGPGTRRRLINAPERLRLCVLSPKWSPRAPNGRHLAAARSAVRWTPLLGVPHTLHWCALRPRPHESVSMRRLLQMSNGGDCHTNRLQIGNR
jgi:hypothetical protein